ncbi:MAG: CotH kinase family protein, partial [Verrucomicrobia bacterium]|nr:CotH kinase family protein [Verrucomicrobiota bacterium]
MNAFFRSSFVVWRSLLGWIPLLAITAGAALTDYDARIASDAIAGIKPLAALAAPASFFDTNRVSFNFGSSSGDATLEFIVEGDPLAGGPDGYLAVGLNASSSLRFEQWNNTGQVGFTQSGVADYLFSPAVPSPTQPTHLGFVWLAASHTMQLYVNGSIGGTRTGVSASFALPRGQGYLGNNAGGTEGMVGVIHRVVVYDDALSPEVLQRHADAFTGVTRPPLLLQFTASPDVLFSPAATLLSWDVAKADQVRLDGSDVTGLNSASLQPDETHVYELVASNGGGSVTGRVAVTVNPAPRIQGFAPDRLFVGPGDPVRLSWDAVYGQLFSVSPGPGDVTSQTIDGRGGVDVFPTVDATYTLSVKSPFGEARADATVQVLHPASHVVVSEFMADNASTLRDEDGQFSDWIEIYNPGSSAVHLLGYYLTDSRKDLTQWAFPDVTLSARGFLVVFASGKNRIRTDAPLHANFRLSPTGGYLALVGPGPGILHEFAPSYPPQLPDVSYGVLAGDLATTQAMGAPSPGAPNLNTPPPPQPVEFSRASGTVTNDFNLSLRCPTEDAEIRYTLNGTTPSATNGVAYVGRITIDHTRRVRAIALKAGRSSLVTGESYIRLAPQLVGYRSNLPILVIENFGAGVIPQKGWSGDGSGVKQLPRQTAVWATFDRAAGQGTSSLTDDPEMFSRVGIRGRGAYSSSWQQKPFSVEAESETGDKQDVSPLGMPQHSEWVLYYPDAEATKDPTLLFNTFAYELSRRTGRYSVRFRWVEAFINEDGGDLQLADRRGVYAIIEKVTRGKDRLDFDTLSADGSAGGWLLDLNRMDAEPETGWPAPNGARQPQFFHTAGPDRKLQSPPNEQVVGDDLPQQSNGYLNFDTPNGYLITTQQRAAIEGWFKKFEDVLYNPALWRDPTNGYRKYLDTLDFADYFILNTLTHNGDGLLISMFPWKGRDEKLRMGPAWDYNWSPYYVGASAEGDLLWRADQIWYARLFSDPDFVQEYIDRWWNLRAGPMSDAGFDDIIDGQAAEI